LCVELQKDTDVERIGEIVYEHSIGGQGVPKFLLPVSPGRNLATLVETAARIFINRDSGSDAAQTLVDKQRALLDSVQQV
jgi:serine kinase of HPr protein (carbohydrate metabolism regulator)